MGSNLVLATAIASLLLLPACGGGGGSGSGSSQQSRDAAAPADSVVEPTDYVMPPVVDVIAPSDEFVSACENILAPADLETPTIEEDSATGSDIGFLVDSAVSGVPYETPAYRGITGADGDFQYEKDQAVRFFLGDTPLGELTGQPQITPFDLAGSAVITGMSAITAALEDEDHPFHSVINIAVLLQSLDQDVNPGNTIEITPEIAALFQGASLDLDQRWETFPQEIGLRYALAQAEANSLFNVAHGVVNTAPAIQHLYQTLGINAGTMGISLEQSDEEADGTPEQSSRWYYDLNGNVTRIEFNSSDGGQQGVENRAYDALGNTTRYEREEYGQQSSESRQYDTLGNVVKREADEDGNGINEIDETWRYQYGPENHLSKAEREDSDAASEDTTGSVTTYQYDADGRLIRVESSGDRLDRTAQILGIPDVQFLQLARSYTVSYKYNANGVLTGDARDAFNADVGRNTVTTQYDPQGNVTRYEGHLEQYDPPQPKIITLSIYTYQYDANSRITRKVSDENGDGEPDQIMHYQYDARGNVVRELSDWDADGSPDLITSYEYDTHDNLVLEEQDYEADGTTDETESWPYQYEYDAQGKVVRRVLDQSGDGRPNETVSYAYHANGSLAQEDRWGTEGAQYDIQVWQYDESGNLTREESDYGADGTADSIVNFEYDACSYLKSREMRDVADTITSVESWQRDTQGHLRRYNWNNRQFWIDEGNGIPAPFEDSQSDGFEGWQYDSKGQLIRYQVECQGECIVGFFDRLESGVVNYEYDSNGNRTRELNDRDSNGKPDQIEAYEHDARGNMTRELSDQDGNGEADRVTSYEYDSDNRLTQRVEDEDADGSPNSIETMEYDEQGNTTLETYDGDADGTPDFTSTFAHEYDASGNLTQREEHVDWDANGKTDEINYWEYDTNGNLTRMTRDENADGVLEFVETRQYDASGNLTRAENDWEGDGTPNDIRTYLYDTEGNLTRETEAEDWNEDGIMDHIMTTHYEPTGWGHIFANY